MRVNSIYEIIKNEIDSFPIYKIDNIEINLEPIEFFSGDFLYPQNTIKFQLFGLGSLETIPKLKLLKVTEEAKIFLFNKFENLTNFEEIWNLENNKIQFNITYWYK